MIYRYKIYQLRDGPELHCHRFTGYEELLKEGRKVAAKNYNLAHEDAIECVSAFTVKNFLNYVFNLIILKSSREDRFLLVM